MALSGPGGGGKGEGGGGRGGGGRLEPMGAERS